MKLVVLLGSFSVLVLVVLYHASTGLLSAQGCRMSWMSPSYVLQSDLDASWTPLANRYSLWLYREVGWDSNQLQGSPVLFIPGNAGSSHQVRSIASSATRQYFSSPYRVAHDFLGRNLKPLDFFALEFNEDLSAFHGPTLESQTSYASSAISYILSLYKNTNTSITIIAHSMGGIVATSLLSSNSHISALLTISTPHSLPPARFDRRIDSIYHHNSVILANHPTPILSLCGGATDMQIPSESCVLPLPSSEIAPNNSSIYRRTIFTTALEGAWTGVGHRELVWCHQIRWRLARAALELQTASSLSERSLILDRWLRDGQAVPPSIDPTSELDLQDASYEILPNNLRLQLKNPRGSRTYLLPVPSSAEPRFVLYLSGGTLSPYSIGPQNPSTSLRLSVAICSSPSSNISLSTCHTLTPSTLKLIPNPDPSLDHPFPLPDEGVDESEGVVFFQAELPFVEEGEDTHYVAVQVEAGDAHADGKGAWVVGGFEEDQVVTVNEGALSPFTRSISIPLDDQSSLGPTINPLLRKLWFPNLISNVLLVYRLTPIFSPPSSLSPENMAAPCSGTQLPPILEHPSLSPSPESHYHPLSLSPPKPVLLHTHTPAPYVVSHQLQNKKRGLNLTVYSTTSTSSDCHLQSLEITIDWWATLGRWGTRYWTAAMVWGVGVVAIVFCRAWGVGETGAPMPSVSSALNTYIRDSLPYLLTATFLMYFIPLPAQYFIGSAGDHTFAFIPIAPLLLVLVSGMVCVSWGVLASLMWVVKRLVRVFGRPREDTSVRRHTLLSTCLIFLLVFLVVPWQVAFLGTWVIHLWTCATKHKHHPNLNYNPISPPPDAHDSSADARRPANSDPNPNPNSHSHSNFDHHLLLLMTWLLPLTAPVLAVWARTLATAGLTTPFSGDHNVLLVAPWLVLTDFASWSRGSHLVTGRHPYEWVSIRWSMLILAFTAFLPGPRGTYLVFEVATLCVSLIVVLRIGPRYWGAEYGYRKLAVDTAS